MGEDLTRNLEVVRLVLDIEVKAYTYTLQAMVVPRTAGQAFF